MYKHKHIFEPRVSRGRSPRTLATEKPMYCGVANAKLPSLALTSNGRSRGTGYSTLGSEPLLLKQAGGTKY